MSDRRPRHRTVWSRDVAVVAACAGGGVGAAYADHLDRGTPLLLFGVDVGVGLVACAVLALRRAHPVGVAWWLVPFDVLSFTGTFAYLVAVFTVASRRPVRVAALVASAHLAAVVAGGALKGSPDSPWRIGASAAVVLGLTLVVGMYVAARRALLQSLRERAERLEQERERDLAWAREHERTRLAGEMHDVLAHRISLITLHAGAVRVSVPDLDATTTESLDLMHANARAAMHDLRDVIALLREDAGHRAGTVEVQTRPRPQPTARDLSRLIAQSRDAGLPIEWRCDLDEIELSTVPEATGRHLYRLVQECLTNVHKHTDLAPTVVTLAVDTADHLGEAELRVEVRSALRPRTEVSPGNGAGLLGLHERISRTGGTIDHGIEDDHFVVRARLPRR